MRQLSSIAFAGVLVLAMSGCESAPSDQATTPAPAPAAVASPAAPSPSPAVIAPPKPVRAAAGLIQPTNANERIRQIAKGRKDPFAIITVVPTRTLTPITSTAPKKPVPTVGQIPGVSPRGGAPRGTLPRGTTPGTGLPSGTSPSIVVAPPLPEPTTARAVAVTGVIQVAGETHAIVKAPDEPTSRSVRVGQRLSNGQVLVKRIEVNEGSEPLVILEQYGIEVAKAVGEKPAIAQAPVPGQP